MAATAVLHPAGDSEADRRALLARAVALVCDWSPSSSVSSTSDESPVPSPRKESPGHLDFGQMENPAVILGLSEGVHEEMMVAMLGTLQAAAAACTEVCLRRLRFLLEAEVRRRWEPLEVDCSAFGETAAAEASEGTKFSGRLCSEARGSACFYTVASPRGNASAADGSDATDAGDDRSGADLKAMYDDLACERCTEMESAPTPAIHVPPLALDFALKESPAAEGPAGSIEQFAGSWESLLSGDNEMDERESTNMAKALLGGEQLTRPLEGSWEQFLPGGDQAQPTTLLSPGASSGSSRMRLCQNRWYGSSRRANETYENVGAEEVTSASRFGAGGGNVDHPADAGCSALSLFDALIGGHSALEERTELPVPVVDVIGEGEPIKPSLVGNVFDEALGASPANQFNELAYEGTSGSPLTTPRCSTSLAKEETTEGTLALWSSIGQTTPPAKVSTRTPEQDSGWGPHSSDSVDTGKDGGACGLFDEALVSSSASKLVESAARAAVDAVEISSRDSCGVVDRALIFPSEENTARTQQKRRSKDLVDEREREEILRERQDEAILKLQGYVRDVSRTECLDCPCGHVVEATRVEDGLICADCERDAGGFAIKCTQKRCPFVSCFRGDCCYPPLCRLAGEDLFEAALAFGRPVAEYKLVPFEERYKKACKTASVITVVSRTADSPLAAAAAHQGDILGEAGASAASDCSTTTSETRQSFVADRHEDGAWEISPNAVIAEG
eukprot:TRINITY_DN48638_c0_g1_i1.p1 TRINITY_DN48638_c0_g1~~TRINITY_DN48638_c0_g1_i1.p1  ORF type:complete len:755 (+),score=136.98 TRINITY_DN48638_c0_g1_i1:66-2267(+)